MPKVVVYLYRCERMKFSPLVVVLLIDRKGLGVTTYIYLEYNSI